MNRPLAALLIVASLASSACTTKEEKSNAPSRPAPSPGAPDAGAADAAAPAAPSRGQELYGRFCAACHGPSGHGDGAMAGMLKVKPRSFSEESWTHIGKGLDESDIVGIVRVVTFGIPESGMTPFGSMMKPAEIEAVAAYVLELRGER